MLPVKLDQVLFSIACERRFLTHAVLFPCDQYYQDNEFNREMSFWVDITIFKGSVENLINFEKVHQQFIFGLFFEKLFFTSFTHIQWWFFTNPYHLELIQERNIGWWVSSIRKIQSTLNNLQISSLIVKWIVSSRTSERYYCDKSCFIVILPVTVYRIRFCFKQLTLFSVLV